VSRWLAKISFFGGRLVSRWGGGGVVAVNEVGERAGVWAGVVVRSGAAGSRPPNNANPADCRDGAFCSGSVGRMVGGD